MHSKSLKGTSFGVDQLSNQFYLPDEETDTIVIRMHGLPGRAPSKEANYLGKSLTNQGIAFFAFDFPGIRQSEGYYTYRNATSTAKAVLDYFTMEHDEIYSKIGVYAESFGGSIAVALSNASSSISALFLWSPVLNFAELSRIMKIDLIIKFMEDSGVIKLPYYDNFSEAFSTQLQINPPEKHHQIFDRIPSKIVSSSSDLLFPPSIIRKQLENKYHHILENVDNIDHNLERNNSAKIIAEIASDFFADSLLSP